MEDGTAIFGVYTSEMGNSVSIPGTLLVISNHTIENIHSGIFDFVRINGFFITKGAFVIN